VILSFTIPLHGGNTPCNSTNLDPYSPIFQYFDNSGNSDSGVPAPPYGGYIGADIWFSFTMPTGGVNLIIEEVGMVDPAVGIYEGPCNDLKLLYNVLDENCTGGVSPAMSLSDLTSGQEYFIRVWAQNGTPNGSFGIFLSNTTVSEPGFILHSAASDQGDCILLTPNTNGQQGCAWFEIPMDFSQPFVNTMTANFGNNDAGGADGITLVYQSNGPNYCGGTGQGIGAEGMPNSAIFEFDTWQNGNLADPLEDHTAFNINGDMNHVNSINGPITLGNIEDGADHTIEFHYDGASDYELYFDGVLVLSGSFDFINNCFGGSTTAWWGYTASTGGASNPHTICPGTEEFLIGTQEYQEYIICEGESANGYTESGFYIDYTSVAGGCLHQINTLVTVMPVPETVYIDTTICEGDIILVGGIVLFQEGEHPITTNTLFGCDSNIVVDLKVLKLDLQLPIFDKITCYNEEVTLTSDIETNHPEGYINYLWTGPQGWSYESEFTVNQPGIYELEIEIILDGISCYATENTEIGIDTVSPIIIGLEDYELGCNEQSNPTLIDVSNSYPNSDVAFEWFYNDINVGNSDIQDIMGIGTHYVVMTDLTNGCSTEGSSIVSGSDDRPQVSIEGHHLNCEIDSFRFTTMLNQIDLDLRWFKDGDFFSKEKEPTILDPGTYEIFVSNTDGCKDSAKFVVEIDTIIPNVNMGTVTLECNTDSLKIPYLSNQNYEFLWTSMHPFVLDSIDIIIYGGGQYILDVLNPLNKCTIQDTLVINDLGDSPEISIIVDTLTCSNPNLDLDVNSNQSGISYQWYFNGLFLSNYEDPTVYAPGYYQMEATSTTGCKTIDSIYVNIDTLKPVIMLNIPDTIECDKKVVQLSGAFQNTDLTQWQGPSGFGSELLYPFVSQPGLYTVTAIFDRNGCVYTDSLLVESNVIIPDFKLNGDTLNCKDSIIQINFDIFSPFDSLQWSGPNGFMSTLIHPSIQKQGTYYLHIDIPGNCDVDTTVFIAGDFTKPDVSILSKNIHCDNLTPPLSIESNENYTSITWITPVGEINQDTIYVSNKGNYIAIVTGQNGCISSDSVFLEEFLEPPKVFVEKSNDITCANRISVLSVGPINPSDIVEWNLNDSIILDDGVIVYSGGLYQVAVTNEYGCQTISTVQVDTFLEKPVLQIEGNDLDCVDTVSILSASSNEPLIEFTWIDFPEGFSGKTDQLTLNTHLTGNYMFYGTNQYGCADSVNFEVVSYVSYPEIRLVSPDTIFVDSENLERAIVTETTNNYLNYSWWPTTGISCYDCSLPLIEYDYQPNYTLTVTNEYGCEDMITVYIRENNTPPKLHHPNIISVNSDDINDRFTIYGSIRKISGIERMLIFDRYGNKVFDQKNFPINDPIYGWDGKTNNQIVEQGVYVFLAEIQLINGDLMQLNGDITVIR
jgi:gliding motility-associated-like protein